MTLALDSSVIVDLLRQSDTPSHRRMQSAFDNGVDMRVSAIVVHELATWARVSRRPQIHLLQIEQFLQYVHVAEITVEDAHAAGSVRAELEKAGRKIGTLDVLIAGQAIARGWSVVTRNLKHFALVVGLPLLDWTQSDQPLDRAALLAIQSSQSSKD